jgi:hypothetical protein
MSDTAEAQRAKLAGYVLATRPPGSPTVEDVQRDFLPRFIDAITGSLPTLFGR